jgi:hypothetical protein
LTPSFFSPVSVPEATSPRLFVVVDTEEEFDCFAPFARENTNVAAIADVPRLQQVVLRYRLHPTYVCDHPVAATRASADLLGGLARDGECRIGAHLHPWVTPPFDEPLTPAMSFGSNLGADIERAKIAALTDTVRDGMGVPPRVYKAGRYGFGTTTAEILEAQGYTVDTSVIPHMDFSDAAGPDFSGFRPVPATFGRSRPLLELPLTTGFTGAARAFGEPLHRAASSAALRPVRAVGILARTGLLNKVVLSPEGNTLAEMQALTRALHADGLRIFSLTFHSPSLRPGCSPYVRTTADRDAFLDTIDRYCDFFFTELGGEPTTAEDLFNDLVPDSKSHIHDPQITKFRTP